MNQSEAASSKAAVVVRDGEGPSLRWGPAGVMRILAGAESTDGSFSICEATEPPGSAAPLHVHHAEAEAFYVLEGEIELTCGEETLTAGAGDFVYTPKGVPHKYAVIGDQPARVLLLFSRPGFESFFAEGGTPLEEPPAGPADPEVLKRLVRKYDMELLEAPGH
ncbi:MAG TPA: quercetin 2,3-dioxygenase [Solirubrobacteraceae bacterium]|nr:quercetin 2,3-dioxygenase [Solirubrobacteraceae bacterium]